MRNAQSANPAPRSYLQKGHSAAKEVSAATSPVLTQRIISHV